jgi:hypothetical protein
MGAEIEETATSNHCRNGRATKYREYENCVMAIGSNEPNHRGAVQVETLSLNVETGVVQHNQRAEIPSDWATPSL